MVTRFVCARLATFERRGFEGAASETTAGIAPKTSRQFGCAPIAVTSWNSQPDIASVKQHGLEGVIAKRLESSYLAGQRTNFWLKLPLKPSQVFVIGGFRPDGKRLELLL